MQWNVFLLGIHAQIFFFGFRLMQGLESVVNLGKIDNQNSICWLPRQHENNKLIGLMMWLDDT